jgi:hypothetical protein
MYRIYEEALRALARGIEGRTHSNASIVQFALGRMWTRGYIRGRNAGLCEGRALQAAGL